VLHGSEDTVTDPEISKELEEKAASPDKTLNIYEGFWHSLTAGSWTPTLDSVFAVSQAARGGPWLCLGCTCYKLVNKQSEIAKP